MKQTGRQSTAQLIRPDVTDEPVLANPDRQSWMVQVSGQGRLGINAKRIMARIIDQIRDDGFTLRPWYEFSIADIITHSGITKETAYGEVRGALYELLSVRWEFSNRDGSEWYVRNLLDTTKKRTVGYKNGIVTVLLNPALAPYFIQIAHRRVYQIGNYLTLKSWYSIRFYEILAAFRDTGEWCPTVDQYRRVMNCWHEKDKRGRTKRNKEGVPAMKYPDTGDLIRHTIPAPLDELAGTHLAFSYEPIYEKDRVISGRRKIIALRFTLTHRQDGKIPACWFEHPPLARVVAALRTEQITDGNIARYLEAIGTPAADALLDEWSLAQDSESGSRDRIDDRNAVFVSMGRELQERLKNQVLATMNGRRA